MKLYHICNPENRRAHFFKEACSRLDLPQPTEIAWLDVLQNSHIPRFSSEDVIRLESPGENFEVERRLIERGGYPHPMEFENGRLRLQTEWFCGWSKTLIDLRNLGGGAAFMNHPDEVAMMFDKHSAQLHLDKSGVPIPRILGIIESFDHLREVMRASGTRQVFLKPCHSSSASGVVALKISGRDEMIATTSTELFACDSRLYNSLKIRQYRDPETIRQLVNLLVREKLMAERWFPKASLGGKVFDLRVLVVAEKARHVVVRTSRSPITNLHLGNERGDVNHVRDRIGEKSWSKAMSICESAAGSFPKSHYLAVDLMVGVSPNHFAVAEVNAFGDLIPNIFSQGDDSYTAELRSYFRL